MPFTPGDPNINREGRPIGSKNESLKAYDREKFRNMSPLEKDAFLKTLSPELRYKMAEGNPTSEITGKDGEKLFNDDNKRSGKSSLSSFLGIGKTDQ